jgi:SAM-dependent methyltransferase
LTRYPVSSIPILAALFLKSLYHRWVPARLRYPLGRGRRFLLDTCARWRHPGPLPPRGLLRSVQMTPYIREYLEVGRKSAASIGAALELGGLGPGDRVLDFGCGLARTLRSLVGTDWQLRGCDVDAAAIAWSASAFPEIGFAVNSPQPPLPYPDADFEAIYAVSVFTHFDRDAQSAWMREMARCLADDGMLLVTTMGPHALGGFPNLDTAERRSELREEGFSYVPGGDRFNDNGAFHTPEGLARLAGADFSLESWQSGGLDGFQDLAILRRGPRVPAPPVEN